MVTFIIGGARSGKSSFAENIYMNKKDVVYIATSKVLDAEMKERVNLHRAGRPEVWRTFEGSYNLKDALGKERYYLLDCITVLSSNIMYDLTKDTDYIGYKLQKEVEDRVVEEVKALINEIKKENYKLLLVSNEVGFSLVPENHISRVFRDIQGRINQKLSSLSDEVYLVVAGIAVKIK